MYYGHSGQNSKDTKLLLLHQNHFMVYKKTKDLGVKQTKRQVCMHITKGMQYSFQGLNQFYSH